MNLVDLVRFKGSQELLLTLRRFPNRKFTIRELSLTAKVPFASTWRAVELWRRAGLIDVSTIGRARVIELRKSPLFSRLNKLISFPSSHQVSLPTLKRLLANEKEIKEAHLFGSTARGEEKPESDIDLAFLAPKTYSPEPLILSFHERTRLKLVPLLFTSRTELLSFLKGKKTRQLK
ncbi:MAG: nucleotidyltransferase domain-containing protein [Candidatus Burarchaeum sp.]|nr:nucleotidyltransferase domain-containing protein [Candidatus Burarchaeum sp.]MDO8339298.1 nucleotidyltransferase domain-containing protein [Candidatus Burarchaeum sp.]